MMLMSWSCSQAPNQPSQPEQQHVDQSRDHRRDGQGQIDEGDQEAFAAEFKLGNGPGGGQPEQGVDGDDDQGDGQREPDCGSRIRVGEAR